MVEGNREASASFAEIKDCAPSCSTASLEILSEIGATRPHSPFKRPHTPENRIYSAQGSFLKSLSFSDTNLSFELPPSSFYTSASTSNFLGPPLPSIRVGTPPGSKWSVGIIKDSPIAMPQNPPSYIATAYPDPVEFSSTTGAVASLVAAAALDMEAFGLIDSTPLLEIAEYLPTGKSALEVLCEGALMQDYPNNYRLLARSSDDGSSSEPVSTKKLSAADPDETLSWSQSSPPPSPVQSPGFARRLVGPVKREVPSVDMDNADKNSLTARLHMNPESLSENKKSARKSRIQRLKKDSRASRYVNLAPRSPPQKVSRRTVPSFNLEEKPESVIMETSCWTCKLRRKKCDSHFPICLSCARLGIECRGYDKVRPDFMTDPIKNRDLRAKIKLSARKPKRTCA